MKKLFSLLTALSVLFSFSLTTLSEGSQIAYAEQNPIRVQINEKMIGGSSPMIKNNRTFLPFRAVFEGLDAQVSFDKKSGTIQAQVDNKNIMMKIGSKKATVTVGSDVQNVMLDVAPFVSGGQTYVPLRAVANMTGLEVEYSKWDDKISIYDKDLLIQSIDKDFTIYNKILKNSDTKSLTKTYRSNMDMNGDLELYEDGKTLKAGAKLNFDGLTKGLDLNGKFKLKLDLGDFEQKLMQDASEKEKDMFKSFLESEHHMIINASESLIYLKSEIVSKLENKPLDAWIRIANKSGFSATDVVSVEYLHSLMNNPNKLSLGQILYESSRSQSEYLGEYTSTIYDQMQEAAGILRLMIGDDGFKQEGSSYILSLDKTGFKNRYEKYMPHSTSSTDFFQDIQTLQYKLVLKDIESKNPGMELKFTSQMKEIGNQSSVHVDFDLVANRTDAKMNAVVHSPSEGKIKLQFKSKTVETSETLANMPPSGEKIVDLHEYPF